MEDDIPKEEANSSSPTNQTSNSEQAKIANNNNNNNMLTNIASSSSNPRQATNGAIPNKKTHESSSAIKMEPGGNTQPSYCAGCNNRIFDRFMLLALDKFWHEDCLKCSCCLCRLGEVGSKFYFKNEQILCKNDYFRIFGRKGVCAACRKEIPGGDQVMRARHHVYHLGCFACHECTQRFCVGDRFYLLDNNILCESDYEQMITFNEAAFNSRSMAQMRLNVQHLGSEFDEMLPLASR